MLKEYLKSHRKGVLLYLLFMLIFIIVFKLYQLPVMAVAYAAMLCVFFGGIGFIIDYIRYCRKHKRLTLAAREITDTIEGLPVSGDLIEQDYQAIVHAMQEHKVQLADKMNRQFSDLVEYYTIWAHQIKTPIAAMGLLLQSQDTPQNRELIEELQRIEQYVEMVLCYLRLDADSTDYVIKTYDLDSIIKQALRKYAPQFIRKKIRLEYEPFSCSVLTDEKWLLFVIEQLLSNALKYTKTGTISILLEEPKTLCIRDTGIGIAAEDLPRIFEKGFTGYNGRSDKKSTGIGLYLCRRITQKMGHPMTVTSQIGVGTVVRVDLASVDLEIE